MLLGWTDGSFSAISSPSKNTVASLFAAQNSLRGPWNTIRKASLSHTYSLLQAIQLVKTAHLKYIKDVFSCVILPAWCNVISGAIKDLCYYHIY